MKKKAMMSFLFLIISVALALVGCTAEPVTTTITKTATTTLPAETKTTTLPASTITVTESKTVTATVSNTISSTALTTVSTTKTTSTAGATTTVSTQDQTILSSDGKLKITKHYLDLGWQAAIKGTIINISDGTVDASITVTYYTSDGTITEVQTLVLTGIGAGASRGFNIPIYDPDSFQPNTYYILDFYAV
jgi:FtsP/CotA-like multicopper oxidase with cupredoxin domain